MVRLYLSDGVILYKNRVVVPVSLRSRALNKLHSAHQGVTSIHNGAQQIVFWPGIKQDNESVRVNCQRCNRDSPSQPSLPQEASDPPTSPFEKYLRFFSSFPETIFSSWRQVVRLVRNVLQRNLSGSFAWVD